MTLCIQLGRDVFFVLLRERWYLPHLDRASGMTVFTAGPIQFFRFYGDLRG